MLKKSNLLCSCGGLQLLHFQPGPSSISPRSPVHPRNRDSFQAQCKRFAHVHNTGPLRSNDDLTWPSNSNFSPYDIFRLDRNAPYSKRRFYELAKIYHPDSPCNKHPQCRNLAEKDRLHRYRLLVAAHEILSDPRKREAYDKFGDGWHHRAELFGARKAAESWQDPTLHPKYRRTKDRVDPIFRNATWEDWEAWRKAETGQGGPQTTVVSHNTFASFVVFVVLFVGTAQVVTIGKWSSHVEDRVKEVDEKCSKFLGERRNHTVNKLGSGDQRIQSFLIKRDPSGCGLKGEEEEAYRRILGSRRTTTVADDSDGMGKESHVVNEAKEGTTGR